MWFWLLVYSWWGGLRLLILVLRSGLKERADRWLVIHDDGEVPGLLERE